MRASLRTEQPFERKNWRNAIRFEASEKPRSFSLGSLDGAAALRMGILRGGRVPGLMHVQIHVGNELVREVPLPPSTIWNEYLINLSSSDPQAECWVTFDVQDSFWVAPMELVPARSPKPNVLIVLLDTLRADHCSLYGYSRKTTPHLDAFAESGITFDNMLAASSWTRPSVASLMTGTYPSRHGARTYTDVVRNDVPRIAEVFKKNGYQTYAFARNANVHPYWGLGNEFFNYAFFGIDTSDEDVIHIAKRTLTKLKGTSWFAYIHLLNPHGPYLPDTVRYGQYEGMKDDQYVDRFMGRMMSDDPGYAYFAKEGFGVDDDQYAELMDSRGPDAGGPAPLGELVRESMDLYDSEILEADARFGEILNLLKKTGQFENTMIVFLSDHGEEFFEHENWTHGKTVYEEGLRVPLVVRLPGDEHAGRRVRSVVETVDIAPTIFDFLNIETPEAMQGRTLLPVMSGREDMDHLGFASVFRERVWSIDFSAVKWRHWKLIADHRNAATAWYNLNEDPFELNPLVTPPENSAAMLDHLEALRFRTSRGLHIVFTSPTPEKQIEFGDEKDIVFEGEITIPGMGDVTLDYPDVHYSIDRLDDTITFHIEMNHGRAILPAHSLTHAELIIEASMDRAINLNLRKNGESMHSIVVPGENDPNSIVLANSPIPLGKFLALGARTSAAAYPANGNVYAWFVPETFSISEDEMEKGMRESLEAMGYL